MNIEKLVTLIRQEIEKTGIKCFSPDLPQDIPQCSSISIGPGENVRALNNGILFSNIPFYILIRGSSDDTSTRELADKIYNQLDMKENIQNADIRIILSTCSPPNYAFRDEKQNIHYNINAKALVEWKEK